MSKTHFSRPGFIEVNEATPNKVFKKMIAQKAKVADVVINKCVSVDDFDDHAKYYEIEDKQHIQLKSMHIVKCFKTAQGAVPVLFCDIRTPEQIMFIAARTTSVVLCVSPSTILRELNCVPDVSKGVFVVVDATRDDYWRALRDLDLSGTNFRVAEIWQTVVFRTLHYIPRDDVFICGSKISMAYFTGYDVILCETSQGEIGQKRALTCFNNIETTSKTVTVSALDFFAFERGTVPITLVGIDESCYGGFETSSLHDAFIVQLISKLTVKHVRAALSNAIDYPIVLAARATPEELVTITRLFLEAPAMLHFTGRKFSLYCSRYLLIHN